MGDTRDRNVLELHPDAVLSPVPRFVISDQAGLNVSSG